MRPAGIRCDFFKCDGFGWPADRFMLEVNFKAALQLVREGAAQSLDSWVLP